MTARWRDAAVGTLLVWGALAGSAQAQATPPRLAAPADCATNPNCGPGLKRLYGADATPHLVKLTVADAGIQALDDGLAEVAVAFSSNPQLSRPDIVTLRDDRHMVGADHVVPVVRTAVADALRRRRCAGG